MKIELNENFWDCECENDYIRYKNENSCDVCGALQEDSPNAREDEINTMMVDVGFLYRDADNYKTSISRTISQRDSENIEIGKMITMGELNTPSQREFFDTEEHPFPYQPEYDHNLLEIVSIGGKGK